MARRHDRPRGMRVLRRGCEALLLLVLLAGCAQARGNPTSTPLGVPPSADAPVIGPAYTPITTDPECPAQTPRHLTADDRDATEAYLCVEEDRAVPGDGTWAFAVVRRVTGGLPELLTAYRTPDEAPRPDVACAASGTVPHPVYLHDDRGTHAVRGPVTYCGSPTRQAEKAYGSLVTEVVREQQDHRLQSQLSVDSTCSDRYKDELSIDEQSNRASGKARPQPLTGPVSVCTYRIATDEPGIRGGNLEAAGTLTADQLTAVNSALGQARPDRSCSRHEHTRFALLDGGRPDETVVALDGCAVAQGSGWWRADDQLRQAVGG